MFNDDCKIWKRKPTAAKIWTSFKTYFAIAHEELVESTQTAQTAGFQANNADSIRQTVTTSDNLANATLANRESMAEITLTVSNQTVALTDANAKLVNVLAKITILERDLGAVRLSPDPCHGPRIIWGANISYTHYCWTHGPTCSH